MSEIERLEIVFQANTSALDAAIRNLPRQFEEIAGQAASAGEAGATAFARFGAQVEIAQAKLAALNGDSLAGLRQQFNGLVPDSELAKLQALRDQITQVGEAERIVAQTVREFEAAERAATLEAERQTAAMEKQAAAQKAAAEANAAATSGAAAKSAGEFAKNIGGGLVKGAEAITVIGAATAVFASNFDKHMMTVQHNTTLTDEEFAKLRAGVLEMGKESGLPFDQIANGMMRLVNEGYSVNDALKIGREAMKGARAAGAETEPVFNLLATTMHTFKIPVEDAAKAWNVMHVAANEGNVTVEDFTKRAGPAFSAAAALKLPLNDVAAAYSALTRNGFTAAQSNTLLRGILGQIAHPSAQARQGILDLSEASGVNLVKSMTITNLQTHGIVGVMNDLFKATDGNAGIIVSKLMPSMRGGFGTATLMSNGLNDLNNISLKTAEAMSGQLDPTTKQYAESMGLASTKVEVLRNRIEAQFLPTGERFAELFIRAIPVIEKAANILQFLLDRFLGLPGPVQQAVLAVGAFSLANQALGNPLNAVFQLLKVGIDWWTKYRAAQLAAAAATAATGGTTAATGATAAGGGFLAGAGRGLLAGLAGISAPVAATVGGAVILGGAGYGIAQEQIKASEAEEQVSGSNVEAWQMKVDQIRKLREELRKDPGEPALMQRLRDVETYLRRMMHLEGVIVAKGSPVFETNPAAARAGAAASTTDSASHRSLEQIEAAMAAAAKRRQEAHKAQIAAQAEEKRFTSELAAEQEKLNSVLDGGDKSAQAFAAKLKGLTEEHKQQVLAVHAQVDAANKAREAREKQDKVEAKFKETVAETENRIRAANGTELSGLDKLKAQYPGVSEERLKALLAQKAQAEEAEKEHDRIEKLTNTLKGLQSELSAGTEGNKLHKLAVELTGKAYEDLSKSAQGLVEKIADVKKQVADHKAFDDMQKKVQAAKEKFDLLKLPPMERQFAQFAGGTKVLAEMDAQTQAAAKSQFILSKAHELAAQDIEAGGKSVNVYDAALHAMGERAAETRVQIQQMTEAIADKRMALAAQDVNLEDANRSNPLDPNKLQVAENLTAQISASQNREERARLYRELQALGPDVMNRVNLETQSNRAQTELDKQESALTKLQGKLKEETADYQNFAEELNALPDKTAGFHAGMDAIVSKTLSVKNAFDQASGAAQNFAAAASGGRGSAGGAATSGNQQGYSNFGGQDATFDSANRRLGYGSSTDRTWTPDQIFQQTPLGSGDAAKGAGVNLAQGLAQGIGQATSDATRAANTMAQRVIESVHDTLGIQSPSTVFAQAGQNSAQGYINGLNGMQDQVQAAVGQIFSIDEQVARQTAALQSNIAHNQYKALFPDLGAMSADVAAFAAGNGNDPYGDKFQQKLSQSILSGSSAIPGYAAHSAGGTGSSSAKTSGGGNVTQNVTINGGVNNAADLKHVTDLMAKRLERTLRFKTA